MLFADYSAGLATDLSYQGFDAERAGLPGAYSPPVGELWLARSEAGVPTGCVALRRLNDEVCEMKRLYVHPSGRGSGLGRRLAAAVIRRGRELGYREVRLDTLADMREAAALYMALGFEVAPPYYSPTPLGTVFMALQL